MKIYEVVEHDDMIRFYFFPTKKSARDHVRQYYADLEDKTGTATIEPIEVTPSRAGIAEQLNWLMTRTCFNEG